MPLVTLIDPRPVSKPHRSPPARVVIEGSQAVTTSPEGVVAKMPLELLLSQVARKRPDTAGLILPDGVKAVIPHWPFTTCVWESPPRVHNLTRIAKDQDVKSNALGRVRPADKHEMMDNVRGHLRGIQRQAQIVQSYFYGEHVYYAAAIP